jgi:predicted GNAT family N-acyltransferase
MSLSWLGPGDDVGEVIALRRRVYGGELAWIAGDADVAWDTYDRHSSTMVVRNGETLVACARLSVETDGPLEVSDLCPWRDALPRAAAHELAAEWSRVIVAPEHRSRGLFLSMWTATLAAARARGVTIFCGASTAEKRPLYEKLGFHYLPRPFRSSFFDDSPIYFPAYQRRP